jgi:uncharacterized protein (TIGR03000 family)
MFWHHLSHLKPVALATAALFCAVGSAAAQPGQSAYSGYNTGPRGYGSGYNPYLYAPFNFNYNYLSPPTTAPFNPYYYAPFSNSGSSIYATPKSSSYPPSYVPGNQWLRDSTYPQSLASSTNSRPYRSVETEPSTTAPTDTQAHVRLFVPADAEVWFDDAKTSQNGSVREYVSPPLTPGRNYSYQIRVRWMEGDRSVDQIRKVAVRAGSMTTADFTKP